MQKQRKLMGMVGAAALVAALTTLGFAASASAELTGEFTNFQQCPWTNAEVNRCAYSVTTGGEVVLGSKTVPIVNPVVLQGGYAKPVAQFSKFFEATNGETLSKSSQPVPGGLLGLVPPAESPPLVKAALKLFLENGVTGVNTTLELARPASEIKISEIHLAEEEGVALILPLKAHLENPFLGNSCYVGSSTSPIIWELRVDETSPPEPNKPIKGSGGTTKFLEEGQIIELKDAALVDNAWAAPAASGCGGILSSLVDPVINSVSGLPAAAGHNTAILKTRILETPAGAVKLDDEDHP